jgi:hypothetical protein
MMARIAKIAHVTRTQAVWTLRIAGGAWLSATIASIVLGGQEVLTAVINGSPVGFVFGTFTLVWLAPHHRRDVV